MVAIMAAMSTSEPSDDPVLIKRAKVAKFSKMGKRFGYSCILVSTVGFIIGLATNFSMPIILLVVVPIFVSAVALIPAVIFGYGVSMAEREERGQPFTY